MQLSIVYSLEITTVLVVGCNMGSSQEFYVITAFHTGAR